jgi:hypothetical protein
MCERRRVSRVEKMSKQFNSLAVKCDCNVMDGQRIDALTIRLVATAPEQT